MKKYYGDIGSILVALGALWFFYSFLVAGTLDVHMDILTGREIRPSWQSWCQVLIPMVLLFTAGVFLVFRKDESVQ